MQQLIQQVADENGDITVEKDRTTKPTVQIDISIRDDEFQLFESDNGRLFIKTLDMESDVLVEVIPTSEGPITEIVTGIEKSSLTLCEPAERAESPDVERETTEVIMD
jgi:hypothetical protein